MSAKDIVTLSNDTIDNYGSSGSILKIGAGVGPANMELSKSGHNLICRS